MASGPEGGSRLPRRAGRLTLGLAFLGVSWKWRRTWSLEINKTQALASPGSIFLGLTSAVTAKDE